ncbi:MAG TPA: hypothetical protein ENN97_06050 [Phycisphaerales bacterium]|nr:hypothetical protein [Phycisphaerales bacterium]
MTHFDNEFQKFVDSLRFDDTPSETHRLQLEEKLMEAWDSRSRQETDTPPSGLFYLKRVALAAGFVLAAAVLFVWFDESGQAPHTQPAHRPDPQMIEQILNRESASPAEREQLLAKIQQVWRLIADEDVQALTTVVLDGQTAESIRLWAGQTVVELGSERTLGILEKYIEVNALRDPDDPVVQTASHLRRRLAEKQGIPSD